MPTTKLKSGRVTGADRERIDALKARARELRGQHTVRGIAAILGVSPSAVHRWVNEGKATGRCADCGTPIGKTGLRCRRCQGLRWTREAIIDAIRRFKATHGRWPIATDFNPAHARAQGRHDVADRFAAGDYPFVSIVQDRFGSWSRGVEAAKRSRRRIR